LRGRRFNLPRWNFRLCRAWLGATRTGNCLANGRGFADRQILTHFLEPLFADATNSQQIINTLKSPLRFAHLQNLIGSDRADSGHLLQFLRTSAVDVNGFCWRLLISGYDCRKNEAPTKN
jgi:hypothetical protein